MRFKFTILILTMLSATSCFKSEWYDSEVILRPQEQLESGGDFSPLTGVVVYAFDATLDEYAVESYDDALLGVVTNIESGATLSPIATALEYTDDIEAALSMRITQAEILIVAIDTQNEWYAYADYSVGQNLSYTYIYLPFRPWKDSSFTQGDWTFVAPDTDTDTDTTTEE